MLADAILMPRENDIRKYHLDDALEQINQSEYGAHHLIVYPNQRVLRELYTKYVRTSAENGVLVIALSLQNIFFGHFSRIRRRL